MGGADADTIYGGNHKDTLFGNDGDDNLIGGEGNDELSGSSGVDSLYGDNGADYIAGGADVDKLYGGAGDDTLRGDGGSDEIYSGLGNDKLTGGSGYDMFFFNDVKDSAVFYGLDSIDDFQKGQDRINLAGIEPIPRPRPTTPSGSSARGPSRARRATCATKSSRETRWCSATATATRWRTSS